MQEEILIDFGPDYRGRMFDNELYIAPYPSYGPGYYIWGRDRCGNVIKMVAQPNVPHRKHPHYNKRVQRGWMRKREAIAALEYVKTQLPFRIETWTQLDTYVGFDGGGCSDVGAIKFINGFVLVQQEALDKLIKENMELKKAMESKNEQS